MTSTKLKVIAIITMLIDHTAAILVKWKLWYGLNLPIPLYYIMRGIGRLAFPIFAFLIAEGFFYTRNRMKYLSRLTLFALLSEIPFDLAFSNKVFNMDHQNIFFTLSLGLLSIWSYETVISKLKMDHKIINALLKILALLTTIPFLGLADVMNTDYGSLGVLTIFVFYIFRGSILWKTTAFLFVNLIMGTNIIELVQENVSIVYVLDHIEYSLQTLAAISLILITRYNHKKGRSLKYLFYVFYPGHLIILYLIANLLV